MLQYRNTPHLTTGRTPAELLFNRTSMTKVPEMSKFKVPNSLKNRDKEQKQTSLSLL
jgi:hypothetical protein